MSRYAHVAYCDDIRPEINGKISLMGLYSDTMLLPTFPATIPKLGVVVTAKTSYEQPFKGFSIHIHNTDQTLAELVVSEEEYEANKRSEGDPLGDRFIQAQFLISPLMIDKPTKIEVVFKSADFEYRCNSLSIELAPEGMFQPQ